MTCLLTSDLLVEINCGSPGILPNGWLEGTRTTLHAVVTFRCQEGMTFEGPSYRTICQADGRWSHPLPRCYGNPLFCNSMTTTQTVFSDKSSDLWHYQLIFVHTCSRISAVDTKDATGPFVKVHVQNATLYLAPLRFRGWGLPGGTGSPIFGTLGKHRPKFWIF